MDTTNPANSTIKEALPSEPNMKKARLIVEFLLKLGVVDFCLCAGARNSPFIALFEDNKKFFESLGDETGHIYHHFDERSAGFFALGCAQRTRRPVAIFTTSGTAVSELLSAAIEAYYTHTPLIFVTADRPPTYRGTGAPQSIEQVGIFSHYTHPTADLTNLSEWQKQLETLSSTFEATPQQKQLSLHLNVCFEEPLLDGPIPLFSSPITPSTYQNGKTISSLTSDSKIFGSRDSNKYYVTDSPAIAAFQSISKCPLFIVSGLSEHEKDFVVQQLAPIHGLWWIEALSGLRGHPQLERGRIQSGYALINYGLEQKIFDGIIRIGAVPTTRLWRDLEDKWNSLPVLSLSSSFLSGLSRSSEQRPLEDLKIISEHYGSKDLNSPTQSAYAQEYAALMEKDRSLYQQLLNWLNQFPKSELNLVHQLSSIINEQPIYLGNSLPIREWDQVAKPILSKSISGNRGANGIDGQLSTFFGWRSPATHSWALLGDLTTLYDLNAPWILNQQLATAPWTLAIINNSGGQIFKPMFHREAFLNRHSIQFESWAKMWNLTYQQTDNPLSLSGPWPHILELVPDETQTQQLHTEIAQLWKQI